MKKTSLVLISGLILSLGLATPALAHAQQSNDAARIASQKHNAKISRKEVKARNKAIRKARKSMGMAMRTKNPQKTSNGTMPS